MIKPPINDNRPGIELWLCFPRELGIIDGEAALIASYFGELLRHLANDNCAESGQNLPSGQPEED